MAEVYLVDLGWRSKDGLCVVKIGMSSDPESRLAALKTTCPDASILRTMQTLNPYLSERRMLSSFRKRFRNVGEVFYVVDVNEAVEEFDRLSYLPPMDERRVADRKRECEQCGQIFVAYPSGGMRFCSWECYKKFVGRKELPISMRQPGYSPPSEYIKKEAMCKQCSRAFSARSGVEKFCSWKCYVTFVQRKDLPLSVRQPNNPLFKS